MPEGHTIHRIARDQTRLLGGRRLRVTSPQGRFAADAERVDGAVLEGVEAYGKHLFYWWSTGEVGHVHLGLFGKFRVHRGAAPEPRGAVRMRLETSEHPDPESAAELAVTVELRGPTACSVGPPDDRDRIIARLGPDPLRDDADPAAAIRRMARSRAAIAGLLLDQSVIAGIGNVYRAELLFVHGIHPERAGRDCSDDDLGSIWNTAAKWLTAGVRANRIVTVDRSELDLPKGARIPRREATYVYKRDRCLRCADAITTVAVANRLCYYCPTHQPR